MNIKTAFIRHKFDKETLTYLWESHRIAVQYDNKEDTDPEKYSGEGKNALKKLSKYCEDGVLIGATYHGLFQQKIMLLGVIDERSEIRAIKIDDYWNKTVQLKNIGVINLSYCPVLLAIQPRQKATNFWPGANEILNALYTRDKLPRKVSSLAPSQLEVLCYEYLRFQNHLSHLLLPIGGTMPVVDIYGINGKSERVFAQVTQSGNEKVIDKKIETLKLYNADSSSLFFFGPDKFPRTDAIVSYQSIEEVFTFMLEKFPDFVDSFLDPTSNPLAYRTFDSFIKSSS